MDFEPRGQKGYYERLPDLNLESAYDFHKAFRQWANFKDLITACRARAKDVTSCFIIRFRTPSMIDHALGKWPP